ncbi:MAG: hypothetical protein PVG66_06130, partial [Chromatiales bacterium]
MTLFKLLSNIVALLFIVLIIFNKGNLLFFNSGLSTLLWSVCFPVFLIGTATLVIRSQLIAVQHQNTLENSFSSHVFGYGEQALISIALAVFPVIMLEDALAIYIDKTARKVTDLVYHDYEIDNSFKLRLCSSKIKIHS